ncbi:MAG: DUF6152 family protein [Steroidobacteraceae bacterium]
MNQLVKTFAMALLISHLVFPAERASAHHSSAMFDPDKTVILTGTVRKFDWINPHGFMDFVTVDDTGAVTKWVIECPSPTVMKYFGWSRDSIRAGDKVSVAFHPAKDGTNKGSILSVTLPDGKVLSSQDPKTRDQPKS